jgi:putative sterol carrier protein
VGSVFRLPGSDAVAVDPTSLDPVDVSTAIKGVAREHLAEVMGGDFREIVVGEVFRRFPEFLDARKAERQRLHIGFRIGGRPDGGADRYLVHVLEGSCTVERDPGDGAQRDATLLLDGPDFLRLVTGHINPVTALMTGKLRLRGDRAKALAFNAVMNPPKPR